MEDLEVPSARKGRCLCQAVRFVAQGQPIWVAHCHCESCRRATSSAIATYAGFARNAVTWTGAQPAQFQSSPGVIRRFCAACGSPMSFESEHWPNEIHLFVPAFDAPETFSPACHVFVAEQISWLHIADALPRYARTSADGPPLEPGERASFSARP